MPSPHLSFAGSPHVPFTPSPSHPPTDVASGSSPHIGTASSVISTPQFGSRDIDGRVWIRPGPQNTFDPHHPTRDVLKIIKGKFEGCFESYGEAKKKDEQMVNMWYGEFKRKYKWLPEHERQIKKAFDHKASDGLTNAMYRVRNKIDNGSWIPPEIREQLERKWSQEDWKAKKTSPDLSPSYWDLFQKTHRIKSDNTKWVSSKSEMIAKGRVYGLGPEAGKYKSSTIASSSGSVSPYEYDQMRALVSSLTAVNKSLQDQLQTHEERLCSNEQLIRSSQEESRLLRDHLFQFMESFSLGHPSSQHPCPDQNQPPSTDQQNEEDDHVLDEPDY
ncbi:hypothetical protein SESBI_00986 [Sesbania bispinosa]|nr:hypothetical protein SESBI_00986 [Sesbania bispinosa]